MAANRAAGGLHDRPAVNVGRVVMGGLLAGVVANVCDFITNSTILKADMTALGQRFGMDAAAMNSMAAIAPWIVVDFVLGLVGVFAYAAMRPRFGPGPTTAIAAVVVLSLAIDAVLYGFTSMGMMPMSAFALSSVVELVTWSIAVCVGAAVYQEA